ncbi:MAG: TonB-dependent receptor [Bacteroidota bacterium]|nr:TonB-dependent receptor [Bacteroidota bacterium]
MRRQSALLLFFCLLTFTSFAQDKQKFTISGYVKDASNGEYSVGANVYVKELLKGGNTNQYGFYSITVDKGTYTLVVSYIGYENIVQQVVLDKDLRINLELKPTAINAQEIEVTSEKVDKNVSSTTMGSVKLEMEEIKKLPAFLGEVDVMKTIQLLPGVKSSGDGNTGFYVRGGGPDQNLILLDEAVVYNAAHLLGFFSVFNGDAVKSINLIKGGMPAQYGGRLASVLDISMKEGNNKEYHAEGGIGIISSRLTIQGPIKKNVSSFIVSGRRTYLMELAKAGLNLSNSKGDQAEGFKKSGLYFYDLNAKVNYRLSDKDRLFVSGYFGRDVMQFGDPEADFKLGVSWGNSTGVVRWNHLFSNKLFMNVSGIFSDYNFLFGVEQSGFELKLFSGIRDWNAKVDFGYFPTIRHEVKFGANYIFHTFTPTSASAKQGETVFDLGGVKKLRAHDMAVYLSDDFDVTDKIKIHAGLRYSYFMQVGPFDRYVKDPVTGQNSDTIHTASNKKVADYGGLEPRFNIRYSINNKSSIKASYTYNLQYIHLASLSAVTLPIDTWVPSSELVKPQKGSQYAIGYFRNFKDNMFETSVELYYKDFKNQIEYRDGSIPGASVNDNADNQFVFGTGQAYGVELFIKKRVGKFNGWIGYTLSYTNRKFPDLNRGKQFYAKYDRRHDASVVLSYDLSKKWTFAAIFVYGTGNAITIPTSYYVIDGNITYDYSERNAYRMPAYHRLDLSATYTPDRTKKIERRKDKMIRKYQAAGKDTALVQVPKRWAKNYASSWNFSIFNVYNRHNPYIIYFANEGSVTGGNLSISAKQVYLFPFLPSVTWNFKF